MHTKKTNFSKWRLLGLIPIAIWLYNLIINIFFIPERFGPQNAAYAWHYNLWSCPMMGLVVGLGILFNNKLLTGAGALWGLFPVFLANILMITPTARAVAAAQGFAIPFIKLTPEFEMLYTQWVGKTGVTLILIEEFATHWLGDFLFGVIGLWIIGISKWSFLLTAISFLFTAWFTQSICPFGPPEVPGAPSLFIQAIPMIIIWFVLNVSISGFLNNQEKKKRLLFGLLSIYWLIALLLFISLTEDTYKPLLAVGYFTLYLIGMLMIDHKAIIQKFKDLYQKKVKGILYFACGFLLLFSLVFFFMMRPTLIEEGENPLFAYALFGVAPFLLIFSLGAIFIPMFKRKE